jgi:hypothetical protein
VQREIPPPTSYRFLLRRFLLDSTKTDRRDRWQPARRPIAEDEVRSSFLKSYGYRVLRFWNNQVLENTDDVLVEIEKFLSTDSAES